MYLWILLLGVGLTGVVQAASPYSRSVLRDEGARTPWNLSESLTTGRLIRGFDGTWISDTEFYYKTPEHTYQLFNAEKNASEPYAASEVLKRYVNPSTTVSPDGRFAIVRFEVESIFRHSTVAKYDIYDFRTRKSWKIHNNWKLSLCEWSPTSDKIVYVYKNNVYIHYMDHHLEESLTQNGKEGVIYNGAADWVYEEEVFSSGSAIRWSPDGKRLAIVTFNDTEVETFKYHIYGRSDDPKYQYPEEVDLKYPKVGTKNPKIALKVLEFDPVNWKWVTLPAPVEKVSSDHILQQFLWSSNDHVLALWLNRRQNILSIQQCSADGVCKEVLALEEPKGWINIGNPQCTSDGKQCWFTYWIGQYIGVWQLDLATGKNLRKSMGDFTVTQIYGYDEQNDDLYYQATLESDLTQLHLFRNDECLSCASRDVDGALCKSAVAKFSKKFSYYALTCMGPGPAYTIIYKSKPSTAIRTWQANEAFRAHIKTKLFPTIKFIKVPLGDSFTGVAKLFLPPGLNWDKPDPRKKYPMIINPYGGPNSVRVSNAFSIGFQDYLTTSHNVIYAIIDARGTGNKGKDLLFTINNRLGTVEIEDQIEVTRYLQKTYSFIDAERCGIWGWSYGGYLTAMALGKDDDRVFQCGVSVAPVTSWSFYDTIYTERYMGLNTKEDNLINYQKSDVMSTKLDNFKHHDFLLIHGSGDDNVHVQNSMLLARALQKQDIMFEEQIYPDADHSINIYLDHLYKTMDHFWVNCLNLDVDEE